MAILISNIKGLVNVRENSGLLRGKELSVLPITEDAYLIVEGETIAAYGSMKQLPEEAVACNEVYNAEGKFVLPSWCDSHTHLVFAGSREGEFRDKIQGLSYAEIAAKGGGILSSAQRLNDTPEDELFATSYQRLGEIIRLGTGAIEIKSGYGLTVEGELKMLRVIKRLKSATKALIKSTFLGAHAVPVKYKNDTEGYINLLINEMLPTISEESLADYVDVFCEKGFFTVPQMERICITANGFGLAPKLHVNQLNSIGGVQKGIALNAVSVDHLEVMTDDDIHDLSASATIGTLLPTAAFFLRMPYQPARRMIDAGCAIALASDYNPGSSPSGNMNFVVSLSCIQLRLLPEEAINAATLNGAHAMQVAHQAGSITIGKKANLIITKKMPSVSYFPYSFGTNLIEQVMIGGEWV